MDMKPNGDMSKTINSGRANTREAPAKGNAGPERQANMKGAMGGMPSGGLKGALSELKRQHPFTHDDTSTHHGDMSHVRHEPLAGMKPASGKY